MTFAISRSRVRVLMQSGPADCGPACLRMVLGHFGRHVSERELSAEPVSQRDGVTAAWLIACAQCHGLHAEGFEVSVNQLGALPTPAILHTKASHFVVFEGWARERIVVVDPSAGERWYLDESEARDMLSGSAIAFEPAAGFERRSRYRLLWRAISPLLAFDRASAVVASAAMLLTALTLALGTDWLWATTLGALHRILPGLTPFERTALLVSVLSLCVLPVLGLVDTVVRSQVSARLERLGAGAPADGHDVAQQPPTESGHRFAAIDPRTSPVFPELSRIVLAASALLGAVYTSWSSQGSVPILLAAFSASLAVSVITAHLAPPTMGQRVSRRDVLATSVSWGRALASVAIWLGAFHLDGAMGGLQSGLPLPRGMPAVAPPLLLALATFRLGDVIPPAVRWLAIYEHRWGGFPERSSRSGIDCSRTLSVARPRTSSPRAPLLLMTGVTFKFGDSRDRLLSELDFELGDGEHVAFVGPAAVGKTTLIRAILGSVRPSGGTIHYCGRSLIEHPPRERMRLVHGMTQGESLPDNTIGRIIRAYNSDLSSSQMRALCARLGFDDEFSRLPLGYDTPVSFDGNTLSRGQRQMLSLARAVASGARILALDDPVNALDDAAARRVLEGLATLSSAVVITMASESALSDVDVRVVYMRGVRPAAEESRYGAATTSGTYPSPTFSHRA